MSLTLYNSIGWAVEKQTIAAGGGLTGPVLVSAVSTDPNTVRLTFDRKLMLEYRQAGVYHAGTLDLSSFGIAKVSDSTPLEVVRTIWINDTTIDLATANQQVFTYRVTCFAGGVMDFWGNTISAQSITFIGQQKVDYTIPADIHIFTSGYPGMQEDETGDTFYPDLAAPYLQNLNPPASGPNEDPTANVYLEIRDDGLGVDLASVRVWVEGTLAYRGDTNTFLAPYNGPGCSMVHVGPAWQLTIDPVTPFNEHHNVVIRVYAQDLAVIYNTLDTTYSYHTWDHTGPLVDYYAPTGTDISRNTLITFSVDENSGAGVKLSTLNIRVDGAYAIFAGLFQPGFDGPSSSIVAHLLGYDVTIQKTAQYDSFYLVAVDLYVEDNESNVTSFSWSFRTEDYLGPLVHPTDPTNGYVGALRDTNIVFEVTDEQLVISGSVKAEINRGSGWVIAFDQGGSPNFKTGYDGPASVVAAISGGYRVTIDPTSDFGYAEKIYVRVTASDPPGNPERLG